MENKTLKICFTSDVHGYIYPTTYGDMAEKQLGLLQCAGGFGKDENTLVIDGGDMLQGSAFAYYCMQFLHTPEPLAQIVNDCGYDYYTLGNHDFNYGQEYQKKYRNAHNGTCICQNMTDNDGNVLYPARIHVMPNGLRVGLVGIVTDYINIWERKENLKGIRIVDPFEAAKQALDSLKDQADFTVCIYHGGFEDDLKTGKCLSKTTENVGCRICRELSFDVLLTGHQHMSVDGQSYYGTYVIQPLEYGREYCYLEITKSDGGLSIQSEKRKADVTLGKNLRERYLPLENEIQRWLNEPLGHLSEALLPTDKLTMARYGSKIADFINRIQLEVSGADVSAVGLANDITGFQKEVSTRDVIATYPYPNTLVVCRITGKQLRAAIERSAEYFAIAPENKEVVISDRFLIPKKEHYNYDYYAGIEYEIDPYCPIGKRVVKLERNGKEILPEEKLTICLNNYRYSGAGEYPMYPKCPLVREINVEMVEILLNYFHEHPFVEV